MKIYIFNQKYTINLNFCQNKNFAILKNKLLFFYVKELKKKIFNVQKIKAELFTKRIKGIKRNNLKAI